MNEVRPQATRSLVDARVAGAVDLVLTNWDGNLVHGLLVDGLLWDRIPSGS